MAARKGSVLAAKSVGTQGRGSVCAHLVRLDPEDDEEREDDLAADRAEDCAKTPAGPTEETDM